MAHVTSLWLEEAWYEISPLLLILPVQPKNCQLLQIMPILISKTYGPYQYRDFKPYKRKRHPWQNDHWKVPYSNLSS